MDEKQSIRMISIASKATIFALLKQFLIKSRRKFIDKKEIMAERVKVGVPVK